MADSKPEWIPAVAWDILQTVEERNGKNDGFTNSVKKLLTDDRLVQTWQKLSAALATVKPCLQKDAAEFVIGGICLPLQMYAATGTVEKPTPKLKIRNNTDEAQRTLERASIHLQKAAKELQEAAKLTSILPDEAQTLWGMVVRIFEQHGQSAMMDNLPSYIHTHALKTVPFLETLAKRLIALQKTWEDVPGMRSAKSTWRDWLAEAVSNFAKAGRVYGADFSLKETHWVMLAHVLIDSTISRESVNAALRGIRNN